LRINEQQRRRADIRERVQPTEETNRIALPIQAAVGSKYAHRATDIPAGSSSPMKLVNPPVVPAASATSLGVLR
jgi:hypothetical protein